MAEKKDRKRDRRSGPAAKRSKHRKTLNRDGDGERNRKRTGPRLPNALRKELELLNPSNDGRDIDGDETIDSDAVADDVYEYEEEVPQEESRKNRRFDPVENLEYQLPDEFEDEDVASDDDNDDTDGEDGGRKGGNGPDDEGEEDEDEGKHARMLQGITGMPSEAFQGKKKRKVDVVSEAYPESEYNPTQDVLEGDGRITVQDLLEPLQGRAGYSELRKRVSQIEKNSMTMHAPLPKADREKLERKVAYEHSKKDITRWDPLVKRNRETPTMFFDENINLGYSTVGAIASEFQPRTEFEMKIASLVYDDKIMEAHKKDGARLLELNLTSVEDERSRRERIAKMRGLLFRHEMKQKHIKKIKSKTYHRLMKKDKLKAASVQMEMDPEAAKEQAMKQEFKRAEERMTLKHKNSSKWAKRILKRGLDVQEEGTRVAIAEQLNQHALLTRKMNSVRDNSSSDESSDEDDDLSDVSDHEVASNLLEKAKEKTLKVMEEGDEVPNSGVLSLPFMVRGLKKKKDAAKEEARLALEEYELSAKQMEDEAHNENASSSRGRMVFGAVKHPAPKPNSAPKTQRVYDDSDYEEEIEAKENSDVAMHPVDALQSDNRGNTTLHGLVQGDEHHVFKSFDDMVKDPGPNTTYDVAIFASDKWRKIKSSKEKPEERSTNGSKQKQAISVVRAGSTNESKQKQEISVVRAGSTNGSKQKQEISVVRAGLHDKDAEEASEDSGTDDDEVEMVDGILSNGPRESYELPSQDELIRQAFAGDDVEEDFEKDKQEILNKENPEPEKPVLVPGWGQWTHVQQKKGMPSWMLKEHEDAKKKREEALKKRKDANLKNVVISEKIDKKAEKLLTTGLPFPFTSKDVFEQSIRMPLGPDFNPATAIGALNRPDVVKKSGIIIKPIKFKEVDSHERAGGSGARDGKAPIQKSKTVGKKKKKVAKANKR